jgi:hypothetical protein
VRRTSQLLKHRIDAEEEVFAISHDSPSRILQ